MQIKSRSIKNLLLLFFLFLLVMLVNQPIISFNMIYQEQASIYLANQTIHSWRDLLNIYLHPAWLNMNIPFFRPSGHFLIYQLLVPFIGWHNTFAFNIISFTFLTLTGFFIIKLYQLLFPSYIMGGLIAFSLVLMHPSLSISRLTFMHFDFAYAFFLVLSLYLFALFCQKISQKSWIATGSALAMTKPTRNDMTFIFSLIFYAIAVTFKEPAIMLGPVLFCYYCICSGKNLRDKSSLLILFSITATSAFLAWYLFLSWPGLQYAGNKFDLSHTLGTANVFIKDVFGIQSNLIPYGNLPFEQFAWRTTLFTPAAKLLMWLFFWLSLAIFYYIWKDKTPEAKTIKKSLIFLIISAALFMLLPLSWASGAPWHHSLSLICLSLIMGFAAEYFLKKFSFTKKYSASSAFIIAMIIAWVGITLHFENIIKYYLQPKGFLGISLNRNAILSPPDIKHQLNKDSILVVEDSKLHNDYFLGNAAYPFLLFFTNQDYDKFQLRQKNFYQQFDPVYSGNLFRYAYLMPTLKEELYPFQIEFMDDIPNEILYNWLRQLNNIFCLGYDASGNWHDKTLAFKAGLAKQQAKRHLAIHAYQIARNFPEKITFIKSLPFPDKQLCEYACDQDKTCKGFLFRHVVIQNHHDTKCYFY